MQLRAFTMVEVVIAILILAILAAVAAPKIFNTTESAELNATISQVRAIEEAASRYKAQTGEWPSFTYWYSSSTNNLPGDFDGYIPIRAFKTPPPIGGISFTWFNLNGYRGVSIFDTSPDYQKWQLLDDAFDDGDTAGGAIVIYSDDPRFLIFRTDQP